MSTIVESIIDNNDFGNINNSNNIINNNHTNMDIYGDNIQSPLSNNNDDNIIKSTPIPLPRPSKASVAAALSFNNNNHTNINNNNNEKLLLDLYKNEYNYMNNLNELLNNYINPIIDRVNSRHTDKLIPFFHLIKSIFNFHSAFLIDKSNNNNNNNVVLNYLNNNASISCVFSNYFEYFQLYVQYSAVYQQSISQIKLKCKQSKKLKSIIYKKEQDKNIRGDECFNYLAIIINRMQVYYDYLQEINKSMNNCDNDLINVINSLESLVQEIHFHSQNNTEYDIQTLNNQNKLLSRQISPPSTPSTKHNKLILNFPNNNNAINHSSIQNNTNNSNIASNINALNGVNINNNQINSQIFHYVPRIVIERFLHTEREMNKLKLNNNMLSLLPTKPESYNYKHAALLIADISGFTKLNEKLKDEELQQRGQLGKGAESVTTHLNKYFNKLLNIIECHGGDCVKFAGDALIVAFFPNNVWSIQNNNKDDTSNDNNNQTNSDPSSAILNGDNIEKELFPDSAPCTTTHATLIANSDYSNINSPFSVYNASNLDNTNNSINQSKPQLSRPSSTTVTSPSDINNINSTSSSNNSNTSQLLSESIQAKLRKFRFSITNQRSINSNNNIDKDRELQAETCLRAVQCALQLQNDVGVYTADNTHTNTDNNNNMNNGSNSMSNGSIELSLHIAISSGSLYGYHCGGYKSEWEFFLTGTCFKHIGKCIEMSKTGEVLVTKKAWELINNNCEGIGVTKNLLKTGDVKIIKVIKPVKQYALPTISFDNLCLNHSNIAICMRSYVPRSVLDMLDARRENWLSEIRTITVIFVNLKGLILNKHDSEDNNDGILKQTQTILFELQRIIHRNEGYRRQFLLDDKGSTLIVVFGVNPYAHEDDAYRSIKTVFEIREKLLNCDIIASYGIATGTVYVGSVGSLFRQEHAVVGDTVNTAARLSSRAADNNILIDENTYEKIKLQVIVKGEGEILVKGKKNKLKIFCPIKFDRLNVLQTQPKGAGETMNRNNETALFMNSLVDLQTSNINSTIFVEGEPGIGKSHLIRNFYRIAINNNDINVYYTKGESTETSTSLSCWTPVIELLMKLSPPTKNGSNINKRTKQVIKYIKNMLEDGAALNDPRLPFINLVLSEPVNLKDTELSKGLKSQHKQILIQAQNFVYYILSHAITNARIKGKYTVMFVEDIHLLDTASMQVLIKLAEECKPIMLVITARPPNNNNNITSNNNTNTSSSRVQSRVQSRAHSRRNSFTNISNNINNIEIAANDPSSMLENYKLDNNNTSNIDNDNVIVSNNININRISSISISNSIANYGSSAALTGKLWYHVYPLIKKLPSIHIITLEGLNHMTCTRLVCQRLQAMSIDYDLSQLIMRRSKGNPLYATEVASHLLNKGYITVRNDGHCCVSQGKSADEASLDLPNSLKGLVIKRIDSLPINELLLCKLASVFGYEDFNSTTLFELCKLESLNIEEMRYALINLVNLNILAKRQTHKQRQEEQANDNNISIDGYYYFCHELVHSACYEMLLFSQKLRLHKLLAELEEKQRNCINPNINDNYENVNDNDNNNNVFNNASLLEIIQEERSKNALSNTDYNDYIDHNNNNNRSLTIPPRTRYYSSSDDTSISTSTTGNSNNNTSNSGTNRSRRVSILSYHYSMALQSYSGGDIDQDSEMKVFIQQAKQYLNKHNHITITNNNLTNTNKEKQAKANNENNSHISTNNSMNNAISPNNDSIKACLTNNISISTNKSNITNSTNNSPHISPLSSPTVNNANNNTNSINSIPLAIQSAFSSVISRKPSITKRQTLPAKFNSSANNSPSRSGCNTPILLAALSPNHSPRSISPQPQLTDVAYPNDYILTLTYASLQDICAKIKMNNNMKDKLIKLMVAETRNSTSLTTNKSNNTHSRRNNITPITKPSTSNIKSNILGSPGKQRNNSVSGSVNISADNNTVTLSFATAAAMQSAIIDINNKSNNNSIINKSTSHTRKHSRNITIASNNNNNNTKGANNTPSFSNFFFKDQPKSNTNRNTNNNNSDNKLSIPPSTSSATYNNNTNNTNSNSNTSNSNNNSNNNISGHKNAVINNSIVDINNKLRLCVSSIIKLNRNDFASLKDLKVYNKAIIKLPLQAAAILIYALNNNNKLNESVIDNEEFYFDHLIKSVENVTKFQICLIKLFTASVKDKSLNIDSSVINKLHEYINNNTLIQHKVNNNNQIVGILWLWTKAFINKYHLTNNNNDNTSNNNNIKQLKVTHRRQLSKYKSQPNINNS